MNTPDDVARQVAGALDEAIIAVRLSERVRSTLPLLKAAGDILKELHDEDPELGPEIMAYLGAIVDACGAGERAITFISERFAARVGVDLE